MRLLIHHLKQPTSRPEKGSNTRRMLLPTDGTSRRQSGRAADGLGVKHPLPASGARAPVFCSYPTPPTSTPPPHPRPSSALILLQVRLRDNLPHKTQRDNHTRTPDQRRRSRRGGPEGVCVSPQEILVHGKG